MQVQDFHFIDTKQFFQASLVLAEKIKATQQTFDYVIAINRGGAVLGRYLSDLLDIQMGAFAMASYVGINLRKELKITQELNLDLKDKKILVVDEICDTGNTFIKALHYLEQFQPQDIKTASLVVKSHAVYKPDFLVTEIDKWVVFPYEMRETILATQDQSAEVKQAVSDFFVQAGAESTMLQSVGGPQHD